MKVKVKVKSLSRVQLLVIPWTVAHQAPPSWDFPYMFITFVQLFYFIFFPKLIYVAFVSKLILFYS